MKDYLPTKSEASGAKPSELSVAQCVGDQHDYDLEYQ